MAQTSYSREERNRKPLEVTIDDEEREIVDKLHRKHKVSRSIVVGAALMELAVQADHVVDRAIEASAQRGGNRRQPPKKPRRRA